MRQRRMIGAAVVEDCLLTVLKAPCSPGLVQYRRSRHLAEAPGAPRGQKSACARGNPESGAVSPSWGRQKCLSTAMTRGVGPDFAKLNADTLDRALRARRLDL